MVIFQAMKKVTGRREADKASKRGKCQTFSHGKIRRWLTAC